MGKVPLQSPYERSTPVISLRARYPCNPHTSKQDMVKDVKPDVPDVESDTTPGMMKDWKKDYDHLQEDASP